MISVSELRTAWAMTALEAEWDALLLESAEPNAFLSPAWCATWWRHFGGGRELRLFTAREDGRLVGVLPLFEERVRRGGVGVTRWALVGEGDAGADYLGPLAARGNEARVSGAFAAHLRAGAGRWDVLELDGVDDASPALPRLLEAFPAGPSSPLPRQCDARFECPFVPCVGTFDDYLAGVPRRDNLRRREKWLAQQPGFRVDVATSPADVPRALEQFFALHAARWQSEGGSDGITGDALVRFHRDLAQRLAERGWLRLYTLSVAGRAIASVHAIHVAAAPRGKLLYYQSGYDPAWGARSPGLVLLARVIRDAFELRCAELDFLRGCEPYKRDWARGVRRTVRLSVRGGAAGAASDAGLALAATARSLAKRALGGRATEAVRYAKRRLQAGRASGA